MRYRKSIFRDKTFLIMAAVTILSLCAIASGILLVRDELKSEPDYIADMNETSGGTDNDLNDNGLAVDGTAKKSDEAATKSNVLENQSTANAEVPTTNSEEPTEEPSTQISEANISEIETFPAADEGDLGDISAAGTDVSSFTFTANSILVWPTDTSDVIVEYSPDATIYFATLDKYKTSDYICIRSDVDTPVYATIGGTISDIGYNEEIGNNLTQNLGSGYELQYGQLKDLQVEPGDVVQEGDLLGYVAAPTKYYTVEGPNLYLRLTADGVAVDPLDYLNYK